MRYMNMSDEEFKKERVHSIAVNVRTLLEKHGIKQTKLAEYCGVQRSTMSDYLNERSAPSFGVIQKMADFFEVPKSSIDPVYVEFLTEKGIATQNVQPETKKLKVYGRIAAGQPIEAIEEVIDEIVCPYTKFNPENLFALQVCGDSMNKIIQDGDYAVINRQPTVNDGEIAAVLIDGSDATLKKFYRLPDKIALYPLSTNSIHKPIEITEADNIEVNILGKFICGVTALQEN